MRRPRAANPGELMAGQPPPHRDDAAGLQRYITSGCASLGFAACGFAPCIPSAMGPRFAAWLAAGQHGEMAYLEDDVTLRCDPRGHLPGAASLIVVADQYAPRGSTLPSRLSDDRPKGRIARYAHGRNYHDVMKKRLHRLADHLRACIPGSEFRTCVDTAPIFEREAAIAAGLGWGAKNTMLIHPVLGSYILLGVIVTNLELVVAAQAKVPDHCGTCTRCIDACPTGAIEPYSVNASRCISYLTIEHRSPIAPEFHAAMGDWVYGCDICQEVCPHNSPREGSVLPIHPAYAPANQYLDLLEVIAWTAEQREQALRSSAMKRANLEMLKRNATIAMGNISKT
jgi:epoxyqueuosine reductase